MTDHWLQGKRVILGVSGGIAAYKSPLILRELTARGANVRVVITRSACEFVAVRTLHTLSRHPVHHDLFASTDEFAVLHVGLADWADLILVAPATANLIGKMAGGLGDDLLSTLLLSYAGPTALAPSMEESMWRNPVVRENLTSLRSRGVICLDPESGELASGAVGVGRLPEPECLVEQLIEALAAAAEDLQGMRLLITAGPTVEDVDPIRFISNRSTGKMGYALARRARERGASVWLVSGPTSLDPPAGVEVRNVRSTLEMQAAVEALFERVDGAILAAAVADFRVRKVATEKIKRGRGSTTLELIENPDIAALLGSCRKDQVLVGFAMETASGREATVAMAKEKLRRKNLDLIALNNLQEEGAGFAVDTNVVTLIDAQDRVEALGKMSKLAVADEILDRVRDRVGDRPPTGGSGRPLD